MKIHKRLHEEGTKAILITLAVVVAMVILVNWLWPSQTVWHYLLYVFELLVFILTIRFFRVPIWRKTTMEEDAVVSPADGVVAANEVVMEDEYFHDQRRQISIFMSIYDVHINFFPFDGEVTYYKYHPGKFLLAFKPKSSTDNEHNTIILKDKKGREILVRQIAGFVARRIVCDLQPGEEAVVGEELGMIRFGSCLEIVMPAEVEVCVKKGEKVTGGQTVIGRLKD